MSLPPEGTAYGNCYEQSCCVPFDDGPRPLHVQDEETPTLEEAELALNAVINFLADCEEDLISDDEMDILRNVKFALFQYANGIPFERSYQQK